MLAAGSCVPNVPDGFADLIGREEFVDRSGPEAKPLLGVAWPSSVDPAAVESVSYKKERSRDSYSSWYRIQLTPDAAAQWADHVHATQERSSKSCLGDHHEGMEGVRRTVPGPAL